MENGEVREIVRLEGQAAKTDKASSGDRWHAAQLIAGQLGHKTFRQLSQDIKAAGGKGSLAHLERMKKCWDYAEKELYPLFKDDFLSYPDFTQTYQSEEARPEKKGEDQQRQGQQRTEPTPDEEARVVRDIIERLAADRDRRSLLTDAGLNDLRNAQRKLAVLIRHFGR